MIELHKLSKTNALEATIELIHRGNPHRNKRANGTQKSETDNWL
jgi:hypothetical protein